MQSRDAEVHEWLDGATLDRQALQRNLRDIRRINALLGWRAFTIRQVACHLRARQMRAFSLLDVASGSADMPLAVARWADHAGIEARIVATDINPEIVALAREYTARSTAVRIERQNALTLPYASGAFDIALCTLALHHFDPESAVQLLRNLARVGRHIMVFDVARSQLAYAGAILLTRLTPMDAMTRHDAPTSVRRAYSAPELRTLAAQAGLRDARVWVGLPFRLALEAAGAA
jgi:ubiquinone/menaquinone biosynthesis C-methylase UbiE